MDIATVMGRLRPLADEKSIEGMKRVGISPGSALGVKIPNLRALAREIGTDHALACALWEERLRETMILASMVASVGETTQDLMERWAVGFYDWEVTDQTCMNLFEKTPFAVAMAGRWSGRPEEFVRRAGFVLMARLAVSDKRAPDDLFLSFFPAIRQGSTDGRAGVKKAVNWAVRQIGKRNRRLNGQALLLAGEIARIDSKSARWIAADAIRELKSTAVLNRLK
jgi:3-methyladenine DNA glycosylase AlkD